MTESTLTRCEVSDCGRSRLAKGWCSKHYKRWKSTGDPLKTRYVNPDMTLKDRLQHHGWKEQDSGCWVWLGGTNRQGYGTLRVGSGNVKMAHRIAYEVWVGPIPRDLPGMDSRGVVVRHKCDNPPCINPEHLDVGTNQENMDDRVARMGGSKGERNPRSKLTLEQVQEIRTSQEKSGVLARRYGVTPGTVWEIRTGRSWK